MIKKLLLLNFYVEELLARTKVRGFPIISSESSGSLIGFIDRVDLIQVIGA